MNRILITGGAGFIGYHLAKKLEKKGWYIDLVDDLSWKKHQNYGIKHWKERVKTYTSEQFDYNFREITLQKDNQMGKTYRNIIKNKFEKKKFNNLKKKQKQNFVEGEEDEFILDELEEVREVQEENETRKQV